MNMDLQVGINMKRHQSIFWGIIGICLAFGMLFTVSASSMTEAEKIEEARKNVSFSICGNDVVTDHDDRIKLVVNRNGLTWSAVGTPQIKANGKTLHSKFVILDGQGVYHIGIRKQKANTDLDIFFHENGNHLHVKVKAWSKICPEKYDKSIKKPKVLYYVSGSAAIANVLARRNCEIIMRNKDGKIISKLRLSKGEEGMISSSKDTPCQSVFIYTRVGKRRSSVIRYIPDGNPYDLDEIME